MAVLKAKTRNKLAKGKFAAPGQRKLPIENASHVRNALARLNQTQGIDHASALAKIKAAAKRFGVRLSHG